MAFPTTFLDLQDAVVNKMRLDSTADAQKVKDWINQGYARVCIETRFIRGSAAAAALSAGDTEVTVPTAIVEIEDVVPTDAVGTVWWPMERLSYEQILERRANAGGAASQTGAPTAYSVRQTLIEIWPNATGGETLTFWGVKLPTALSADADLPSMGDPYAKVLEYYACSEAALFQRDPDYQTWRGLYENELQQFRKWIQRRQSTLSPALRVRGVPEYIPHDPSTDLG